MNIKISEKDFRLSLIFLGLNLMIAFFLLSFLVENPYMELISLALFLFIGFSLGIIATLYYLRIVGYKQQHKNFQKGKQDFSTDSN